MNDASTLRAQALARKAAGDDAGAAALFEQALTAFPRDAALANSAGNFHAGAGRAVEALALFERALAIEPDLAEAEINRAVMLSRLGRHGEAATILKAKQSKLANAPRYWTTRGAAELGSGKPFDAEKSYSAALTREPSNIRALNGRARAALELGNEGAINAHENALRATPGDPYLLVGYAHALDAGSRSEDAILVAESVALQLPGWTNGLELYAQLRWARGDDLDFAEHYRHAVQSNADPAIYLSWAAMLSGVDRFLDAANILALGREKWPSNVDLALAEAVAAGEAGDHARAIELVKKFASDETGWQIAEARQCLRGNKPEHADGLLERALSAEPDNVAAWSLRDIAWRLTGDSRHEWLHGQGGLVGNLDLELSDKDLQAIRDRLNVLHDGSAMPVGQSVKHGSQTRGALFVRQEPEIKIIASAVQDLIERYRGGLPPADSAHPLLRYRDKPWRIAGSWSIRLDGTGHHAAHIHPNGILSSAIYIEVPDRDGLGQNEGLLELGGPPVALCVDLPPICTIDPVPGHCALFPSTLFHGTRPITRGRRMSVAFDITAT